MLLVDVSPFFCSYLYRYFQLLQQLFTSLLRRRLSSLPTYYVPKDGPLNSYKEYVSMLPNLDHPEAFGQHPNADIASQIQETRSLVNTLLSLQPQIASSGGISREEKVGDFPLMNGHGSPSLHKLSYQVLDLSSNIFKQLPEEVDYDNTVKILSVEPSPLNVVLLQEIQRYNALLVMIRQQLIDLEVSHSIIKSIIMFILT